MSNIICGSWCAMRTDLHVLFLLRMHHWTTQRTYILFVVDDPAAGYWYDDAKTENMYININMLMFDCLFNSYSVVYSYLFFFFGYRFVFAFGCFPIGHWTVIVPGEIGLTKNNNNNKNKSEIHLNEKMEKIAKKKKRGRIQCWYKCRHPIIQNPHEAYHIQCFNGRLWNV